jgi:photosystem II stability/assembly factor-like uncharacterized protein
MTKTLPVLFILLLFFYSSSAQWTWVNPKPSGYFNVKLRFVNKTDGFILNTRGDLIYTRDAGDSWKILRNFPGTTTMDFKDSTGVIGGFNIMHTSSDNGLSWEKKTTTLGGIAFLDIVSRDTIFALGNKGDYPAYLYRSSDRGKSWQPVSLPTTGVQALDFVDGNHGIIADQFAMYKTSDGGRNWIQSHPIGTSSLLTTVKMLDTMKAFMYRHTDRMLKTADGGMTWSYSPGITEDIHDISIVDSTIAFATGHLGMMYKTTNAGASWNKLPLAGLFGYTLDAVYFTDKLTGYATGFRGRILKTIDGGNSWTSYAPSYVDVTGLSIPSVNNVFTTTWFDFIKSTNGGDTWNLTAMKPVDDDRLKFLHFFTAETGVIICDKPVRILHTTSGGTTWDTVNLRDQGFLYYDDFTSACVVDGVINMTATGASARGLLRSRDSGRTWQQVADHYPANYQNLHFVNQKTGYATLPNYLYQTEDSGKTFKNVFMNPAGINTIWFNNEKTGFVSGADGFLFQTQDSGRTWLPNWVPYGRSWNNGIVKIKFFDPQIGVLTKAGGTILQTVDSGRTWLPYGDAADYECRFIEYSENGIVYIAGSYGTVMKRNMVECRADSLLVDSMSACRASFSARITAVLSKVDSAWFQYGTSNFTSEVSTSPASVNNASFKSIAAVSDVKADSTYMLRVKLLYKGNYIYSDSITFRMPPPVPKPTITASGDLLTSSVSTGIQWYFNGSAIPGATYGELRAMHAGVYSVTLTQKGCSNTSVGFNYVPTGILDPAAWNNEVLIYPNPVENWLTITNRNNRSLSLQLIDVNGKQVYLSASSLSTIQVNMKRMPKGAYILVITDLRKNDSIRQLIMK